MTRALKSMSKPPDLPAETVLPVGLEMGFHTQSLMAGIVVVQSLNGPHKTPLS